MSIEKLTSIVRRGSIFLAVFAVVAATFVPAASTYADALNPLTNRSLTLSSSAPGWDSKDGSGNSTYAPPNSGANGEKTGNTFSFNVSTDSSAAPIKAFDFQYCTRSAGDCTAPGNNTYTSTTRATNGSDPAKADLTVHTSSPTEIGSATFAALINTTTGSPQGNADTSNNPATVTGAPKADDTEGNFIVMTKSHTNGSTWQPSYGWTMAASNKESGGTIAAGTKTGANNYISLINTTGISPESTDAVKIIFFGTNGNYITNPGEGAFFVKINDYSGLASGDTEIDFNSLVDGGVTVANVMNQSIEIQTKVLETMDFSVGTVDPYQLSGTQLQATALNKTTHGPCDAIQTGMTDAPATANVLQLGDQTAENSLRTDKTYSTHSYWRLSSNSSAGASVYYSGVTLKNTVGDQIDPIGTTAVAPARGTPQFGLALANATTGNRAVNYNTETATGKVFENGADTTANGANNTTGAGGLDASVATDTASYSGYHAPQLAPLAPATGYAEGAGVVNGSGDYGSSTTAKFAFDPNSNIVPALLASESSQVVDCVTAKVRYVANIAATTPAGIYTTKINYIAAPQY